MAKGVTQLMVNSFDGDKVDEYMEKNFDLPEYVDTVNYLYTLRDNYPDILYMYIYRFEEDGYLFTYTRPIFRSDGSYACTACVDFSMDYLSEMDRAFTLKLALILSGHRQKSITEMV
ncbi:MAG: cache domain-containing protein [Eubacterium sp.]|nr:cache domain-containing protein [Eubacterium sp.]